MLPARSRHSDLIGQRTAGTLPLELLIKVLGFLADTRDMATCACVSRLWAKAAGLAVPKIVNILGDNMPKMSYLLGKPDLGAVETVALGWGGGFLQGMLFTRICDEAEALQECHLFG